jgi:hypothetical protein
MQSAGDSDQGRVRTPGMAAGQQGCSPQISASIKGPGIDCDGADTLPSGDYGYGSEDHPSTSAHQLESRILK